MKNCDVRRSMHVPGSVTNNIVRNENGSIVYRFNSHGYRSEEFNPKAKFRICVVGESHAFGLGVPFEQTFGFLLKTYFASAFDYKPDDVNLLNFSVCGASADYCVRTIVRQLADCPVDFLVFYLPLPDRVEYFSGSAFHSFSPATVNIDKIDTTLPELLGFCEYYNIHVGRTNMIKNLLLAQGFLHQHKIPYVVLTQDLPPQDDEKIYYRDYFRALDTSRILWNQFFRWRVDLAADRRHGGPVTHSAVAIQVLSFFGRLQLASGHKAMARRIEKIAAPLRGSDAGWAKCNTMEKTRHEKMNRRRLARIASAPQNAGASPPEVQHSQALPPNRNSTTALKVMIWKIWNWAEWKLRRRKIRPD